MLETLLGGVLGAVTRLAPEILKGLDKRNERKHELALQDKAIEFEKIRGAQKMSEIQAGADAAWNTGAMETFRQAIEGQSQKTGIAWADALSTSVRPLITYSFFGLYALLKLGAIFSSEDWTGVLPLIWTEKDDLIFSSIISFWFLGRIFDKTDKR